MRKKALAQFLNCPTDKIFSGEYCNNSYSDIDTDYLVLTEEEANEEAQKHVWGFIHTFDIDFLMKYLGKQITEEKLSELLSRHCDNCLLVMASLMPDYDLFAQEAIRRYGRAYFICFEDKTEYRMEYGGLAYFIYRLV